MGREVGSAGCSPVETATCDAMGVEETLGGRDGPFCEGMGFAFGEGSSASVLNVF